MTVSPGDPLSVAAGILREHRFHHLPVVEGGRLVGILSDTDLRNASFAAKTAEGEGAPAAGVPPILVIHTDLPTQASSRLTCCRLCCESGSPHLQPECHLYAVTVV